MPIRIPSLLRAVALLAALALPLAAAAVPLGYQVVVDDSDIATGLGVRVQADVTPDVTDDFPFSMNSTINSVTFPSPLSSLTADVGLPGQVGSSIDFSDLSLLIPGLPGGPFAIGTVSVPLDLTGSEIQPFIFSTAVSSMNIVLNDPFSAPLTSLGGNQYAWAGLANVNISGQLNPRVTVPSDSVPALDLPVVPFDQDVMLPLFGTFSGDANGTIVTLGIEVDPLTDAPIQLNPDATTLSFDPAEVLGLPETGLITASFTFDGFAIQELTTDVVYQNTQQPIPEPTSGVLLGLGLVALALRRNAMR